MLLKKCGLFSSVIKNIILYNTTPTFQEVGGVTHPSYFVGGKKTSHGIKLTITKLGDFYSHCLFTFLANVFN